ncbi:hypothetical protein PENTCL1PPCAC_12123, partial [Pristionchus entomophagus]
TLRSIVRSIMVGTRSAARKREGPSSMQEIKDQLKTKYQRKTKDQTVVVKEEVNIEVEVEVKVEEKVVVKKELEKEVKVDQPIDIEDIWKRDLEAIAEMRKNEDAAVDTMGCHMLHDKGAEPQVQRFQILLALMLSSQTKDEVTSAAMMRLRAVDCSINSILSMRRSELEELLKPVGFYRRKAEYIQEAAAVLKEKHAGDIPDTVEGLCALKGVGPKMAHLVMQTAFGRTLGIAVDTHVHRIVNRLGWAKTNAPEQTQKRLEELLPREEWARVNKLLVGFGQQICQPVRPKCSYCLLNTTCPSSSVKEIKKKVKKEEE